MSENPSRCQFDLGTAEDLRAGRCPFPLHINFQDVVEGMQQCGKVWDNLPIPKMSSLTFFGGGAFDNCITLLRHGSNSTGINLVSQVHKGGHQELAFLPFETKTMLFQPCEHLPRDIQVTSFITGADEYVINIAHYSRQPLKNGVHQLLELGGC